MKKIWIFRYMQQISVILFVMIMLSGSTATFYVALNTDFQLVELCDIEDSESEKESKEHEENQDKEISSALNKNLNLSLHEIKNAIYLSSILSNHHSEIQTPPPKGHLS